jgi:hypothetical protein
VSVQIRDFEWDQYNLEHLAQRHPDYDLDLLEEIVRSAKYYLDFGYDRYGRRVYGAKRGRIIVLFNLKRGHVARIFSVRKGS